MSEYVRGRQLRHDDELTLFMNSSALREMANMRDPITNCMGMIQDLRRPTERKNSESTIGDHNNLSE